MSGSPKPCLFWVNIKMKIEITVLESWWENDRGINLWESKVMRWDRGDGKVKPQWGPCSLNNNQHRLTIPVCRLLLEPSYPPYIRQERKHMLHIDHEKVSVKYSTSQVLRIVIFQCSLLSLTIWRKEGLEH